MSDNEKQLENEFLALCSTIGEQIKAKLAAAEQLVSEACVLADIHGIPFHSNISELSQSYVPCSFHTRFNSLSKDDVSELTDVYSSDLFAAIGWRHSQIGC